MAYDATDFIVTDAPAPVRDPKSITDPRERVAYLRDFLRALPRERFNMEFFSRDIENDDDFCSATQLRTDCGTQACIAGWCAALFTEDNKVDGTETARLLLDLSGPDASTLFYANDMSDGPSYWGASPAQAANVLDHYLATGEIDWSVA